MTMHPRPLALALAVAATLAGPGAALAQTLCRPDNTTPFTAGAVNPQTGFAYQVVDSEGVALVICTDSVDGQGNPPPCFFDPVVAGNAQSIASGFGGEGFWFLAENAFATTGAAAVGAVVVMATEAAYLTEVPAAGQQFSFTRLRVRVDVAQPGIYTVQHPWGQRTYTVASVLDDRGRPQGRNINETIDVEFTPNGSRTGIVGPWLRWDPAVAPAAPLGYIGDGATPHAVIGSPCGRNFVRISATALDGTTPLAIDANDQDGDGSTSSFVSRQFTVQGKLAPQGLTPLTVTGATYARTTGAATLSLFATAPTTAVVSATPGGTFRGDGTGRHFLAADVSAVPATVAISATNAAQGNAPSPVQHVPVTDLVTITSAQAQCSAAPRTCTLSVTATSSDQAPGSLPTLTLALPDGASTALVNGAASVSGLTVLPAAVSVRSSAGGTASKPLTVINP
ncbi:hypothetical protein [Sphaerotilus mobilis]|uniref:Uncharacterized protein n=1 Tax=Sphaerotilus mobilis TaxID=47994 RepID=A0A4V2EVQ3_9BURK|nr:hypothetical protein [Sphaerotilus mobilis]RZS53290.1 hypothetical protein EV685_2918 [Sphaerotilus mobilis]